LVYGLVPKMQRSNIVLFFKNSLEQRKPVKAVQDQYRMPTLAEDLAGACLEAAKRKTTGILNISGSELVSIFEFSQIIAEVFDLDKSLIQPVASEALREAARRPVKTGFILEKAGKLIGYKPHSLRSGLELIGKQLGKKAV
jgi:dTDP-4-dehydrorhamnose reductase